MFAMRTSKPGAGNLCYITRGRGGWSWCIQGSPTDANCDVLANCVGYACGRFNEIYNAIKNTSGMKYYALNCNAENFIERAVNTYGLEVVGYPVKGGIMVWQKGATLSGNDGAGHVAVVEKVYDSNHIYTSESGYGGSAFWNQHRYNNDGRWGIGSGYTFRGCIVNPAVGKVTTDDEPTPAPTPGPVGKFKVGDKVYVEGKLYVSSNASSAAGYTPKKLTQITRVNPGSMHPYNTTGDLGWMDEASITAYNEPAPAPTPAPSTGLKVGDKVKITGTGNGSSYGDSNTAYGIGWTREILKIYEGRKFPYQVGNSTGTTGFYQASSLQKL